jgi:hypothetical protein
MEITITPLELIKVKAKYHFLNLSQHNYDDYYQSVS